jgi:hypothetical protein
MTRPTVDAYVHEIIASCAQTPARLELITANFELLVIALKRYDRAPRFFDTLLEDALGAPPHGPKPGVMPSPDPGNSEPMKNRLAEVLGQKMNQRELVKIAKAIADRLAIVLGRDQKRNQTLLFKWFEDHWDVIRPILPDCARAVTAGASGDPGAARGGSDGE